MWLHLVKLAARYEILVMLFSASNEMKATRDVIVMNCMLYGVIRWRIQILAHIQLPLHLSQTR